MVKAATPTRIVSISVTSELDPGERHEAHAHEPYDDEGDAQAPQRGRDVGVLELLAHGGEGHDGEPEADARAHTEDGVAVVNLNALKDPLSFSDSISRNQVNRKKMVEDAAK